MLKLRESVVVILVISMLEAVSGQVCDDGWVSNTDGQCYQFVTTKLVSWSEAHDECNNFDSSLLRIETQDLLNWLVQTMKTYPSSGYWTDLNDNSKVSAIKLGTGVWKWGSNEFVGNSSIIQWNQSPANDGQSLCAGVTIRGTLADMNCNLKQGFICKITSSSCAFAWIPGTGNTNCFWVSNTTDPSQLMTWKDAQTFCSTNLTGASLMVITIQSDMDFIMSEIQYLSQNTKIHWVGLQFVNGQWTWQDNSLFSANLISWQSEPDNIAGIENCGVIRMTGKFSDRDCTSGASYICTKPQYYTGQIVNNLGCGSWIRAGKFCYGIIIGKNTGTWSNARAYCKKMNADLMKVDSYDKQVWLQNQLLDPANDRVFWIGLNDQQTEGKYVWADGTPVNTNFIDWNKEPNDFKGSEDCAMIYPNGQYNDLSCAGKGAAICELDSQTNCQTGWVAFNNNCYLFTSYKNVSQLFTWQEASDYCAQFAFNQTLVGTLLSVDSMDEKNFIVLTTYTMTDNMYGWWTSLNDRQSEGFWSFASGPLIDTTLVDWHGEPSNLPGDNCALVNYAGAYHERNCSFNIPFICERYATGYSSGSRTEISYLASFVILLAILKHYYE